MNNLKENSVKSVSEGMRQPVSEFIGAFLFVFFGVGAAGAAAFAGVNSGSALVWVAIAHGIGITAAIMIFGRVSGAHLNPAVTVSALLVGKIGLLGALRYIAAQMLGAVVAVAALRGFGLGGVENLGVHALTGIAEWQGLILEIILTFILVLTVFSTAMDKRSLPIFAPLAIGLVVLAEHFVAAPLTGASMNPARSFGPALVNAAWADHWVYWIGPLIGGVLAAAVYAFIFAEDGERKEFGKIRLGL